MTALDLSQALGIREREVYPHLEHVARSAGGQQKRLVLIPPVCLNCGFRFPERRRLTRPGRCPKCRATHLERPRYRVV